MKDRCFFFAREGVWGWCFTGLGGDFHFKIISGVISYKSSVRLKGKQKDTYRTYWLCWLVSRPRVCVIFFSLNPLLMVDNQGELYGGSWRWKDKRSIGFCTGLSLQKANMEIRDIEVRLHNILPAPSFTDDHSRKIPWKATSYFTCPYNKIHLKWNIYTRGAVHVTKLDTSW